MDQTKPDCRYGKTYINLHAASFAPLASMFGRCSFGNAGATGKGLDYRSCRPPGRSHLGAEFDFKGRPSCSGPLCQFIFRLGRNSIKLGEPQHHAVVCWFDDIAADRHFNKRKPPLLGGFRNSLHDSIMISAEMVDQHPQCAGIDNA